MTKKFGGFLDEPMPHRKRDWFDEEEGVGDEQYAEQENRNLLALLMHHGLEYGDYRSLALLLAREFLPGFQEKKRRGPKTKWTAHTYAVLYAEIRREIVDLSLPENSIKLAAETLAKQPHWMEFLTSPDGMEIPSDPAETLRRAFYIAEKKPLSQICWKACQYHRMMGTMEEWGMSVQEQLSAPPMK